MKAAKLQVVIARVRLRWQPADMRAAADTSKVSWQQARQSGPALYAWRRSVGLNRPAFAKLARFSERTLATYEKAPKLPSVARAQVTEAVRLVKALQEIIPGEELSKWLETPNQGFGGRKPGALIVNGERDVVWEMIHQVRHGAFA